jgi:hypothetical protein
MKAFVNIIKKEFWGRVLLSVVIVGSFFLVLIGIEHAMLGDHALDKDWKEILMLLLGALIGGFTKVIDFWFKDHTNDKQLLDKIQTTKQPHQIPAAQKADPDACQCEDCKKQRGES